MPAMAGIMGAVANRESFGSFLQKRTCLPIGGRYRQTGLLRIACSGLQTVGAAMQVAAYVVRNMLGVSLRSADLG
jgi:hypothetical protein